MSNIFNNHFSNIIVLNKYSRSTDSRAHTDKTLESSRKVLASIEDVSASEVYSSRNLDLRPSITFVIRTVEYKGEDEIEYDGKVYSLIRKYPANFNNQYVYKLVCEEKIGKRR